MFRSSEKYKVFFIAIIFSVLAISLSDAYMALIPKVKTISGKCEDSELQNSRIILRP